MCDYYFIAGTHHLLILGLYPYPMDEKILANERGQEVKLLIIREFS